MPPVPPPIPAPAAAGAPAAAVVPKRGLEVLPDIVHRRGGRGGRGGERRVRVVHVSDTHGKGVGWARRVPECDVLIHSGDLCDYASERDLDAILAEVNEFFACFPALPRTHKIFVAGNHELAFHGVPAEELAERITEATYLQDSFTVVEGLKIYGSPWNNCLRMAFGAAHEDRERIFSMIPDDADIVVTHQPPFNVLDLAWVRGEGTKGECRVCGGTHPRFDHWGCQALLRRVMEVRPLLSLFGHVHDARGHLEMGGVRFVNSAMDLNPKPSLVVITTVPVPEL